MSICNSDCAIRPPIPPREGCGSDRRQGGISRLVFATCDFVVAEGTSFISRNWCEAVYSGKVVVSSPINGQKPKGSGTSKRYSSCAPETIVGYERSVTFTDLTADNENFSDFDFWNTLQNDPSRFQFGYITCDGLFTGFIPNFTLEVSPVIEDVNTGSSMWQGTVAWTGIEMPTPIYIPNFLQMLTGNCDGVPGFNPCASPSGLIEKIGDVPLCSSEGVLLRAPYWLPITSRVWKRNGVVIPGVTDDEYRVYQSGTYTVEAFSAKCDTTWISSSGAIARTSGTPCFNSGNPATITLNPNGLYTVVVADPTNLDLVTVGCQSDTSIIQANLITEDGFENGWVSVTANFTRVPPGLTRILLRNTQTGCVEEYQVDLP